MNHSKYLMDAAFPDERIARRFARYCSRNLDTAPTAYKGKVFMVLNGQEDRAVALRAIRRLGGRLLV